VAALAVLARQRQGDGGAQALNLHKRCTVVVLLYFLISVLRFAFFIPVTGMAFAAKDVCGLYGRGLADIALSGVWGYNPAATLHCGPGDLLVLAATLAVLLLDAYLVWGVLRLWHLYRAQYLLSGMCEVREEEDVLLYGPKGYHHQGAGLYGAADPRLM